MEGAFANDFENLGGGYIVIGQDCDEAGVPKQSFIEELRELLIKHEKARIFHEGVQKLHFFMKYAG
ncbi:MAG: hypothetical protein U9Q77_07595 [Candidatus Marinimicrobia bacterium]|nr:hypothetical protein [Candidatus Neomarinimicrobiota bacterium]